MSSQQIKTNSKSKLFSRFPMFSVVLLEAVIVCGCEKVPTFKEVIGQAPKSTETAASNQSDTKTAEIHSLQPAEVNPVRVINPQEVITGFKAIRNFERTDSDLARLAELTSELETITEMDLAAAKGVSDVGLKHVARIPNIERLNLSGTSVTTAGFPVVSALQKMKSLEFRSFAMDAEAIKTIVKVESLEQLILSQTSGGEADFALLCHLPELRELDLSQRAISDQAIKSLADCPKLEVLLLQRTPINGSGLLAFGAKKGPPLRVLNVNATRFGEKGMPSLKGLETLEELHASESGIVDQTLLQNLRGLGRLKKLELGLNAITDVGAQAVSGLKSLEEVSFAGCGGVSDKTLGYLKSHKNLRRLDLKGCRISPAAIQAFKKLQPNCELLTN